MPGVPGPAQGLPQPASSADELATAHLVKQQKRTPQSGWRKAVYLGSGKLINPGRAPRTRAGAS